MAAAPTADRARTTPPRCMALARTSGFIWRVSVVVPVAGFGYALRTGDFIAEGLPSSYCTRPRVSKTVGTLLSNHDPEEPKKYQSRRLIRTILAIIGKNRQSSFSYEISYNKKGGFLHYQNPDSINFQSPTKCRQRDSEEQKNGLFDCALSSIFELNFDNSRIARKLIPENRKTAFQKSVAPCFQ